MTSEWRQLALHKQGLVEQTFGTGLAGTRKAIQHLGYVQVDTIAVVERAHHHVLWSRVPGYKLDHLNQLVKKKQIFEYWYHAASYLPMRDYRFALPNMASIRKGENRYYRNVDARLMKEILARVKQDGAIRMRDLESNKKQGGGLWNQGPGKRAFEKLYMQGDLMISERQGMEKVYDLPERCLPEGIDLSMPTLHEYAGYLFDTTLRAHGVFTWKQLIHLKTGKPMRDAMSEVLEERLASGAVEVYEYGAGHKFYIDTKALNKKRPTNKAIKILSPFDNAVIHRDRLNTLFNYDYKIECYVAAPKRVYGYFCLPILSGDDFVGRVDCKAHRAQKRFEVISLHLEDQALDNQQLFSALTVELQRLADFNGCQELDERALNAARRVAKRVTPL